MSNFDNAEKIIRHMMDMPSPNQAEDIAEELADAGLLATDDYAEEDWEWN